MNNRLRKPSGASLILIIAVFGTIALLIMLFCLKFTGMMGSYHEQRTAIEAASLAAAKDMSAIVIADPNFGYIGLSDASPIGTATAASDGYYTPVTGINTLFGTIRLDLIIADYLQDPIMRQMALNDYQNALTAQANLVTALTTAAGGGTGQDVNGNTLNPTQDAVDAYNANNIHLAIGQSSQLVPGSMHLSLGYLDGLSSRTPIPSPQSVANVSSSQEMQGFYASNVEIDYTSTLPGVATPTTAFAFAALGPNATLVDYRAFQSSEPGLPYSTPTIVKTDADEQFLQGGALDHTQHACAAAEAGTVVDQRPCPGAFTISFTDGSLPEINQFGDLINNAQLQSAPTDAMQTPLAGDYPANSLSPYAMTYLPDADPSHPRFEDVLSVAMYDWIRRGGTNINVQSLVSALQTSMSFTGAPQMQRFHLTPSGNVTNDAVSWGATDMCVSNKQYRAISGLAITSNNGNSYDCQITDYVRVPGKTNGGIHAGEPLSNPGSSASNAVAYAGPSMYENTTWPYQSFQSGSGVRPTYSSSPEGIAVDVTIRKRN